MGSELIKIIFKHSNAFPITGIWVNVEGNNTPKWDQYGFVLAPDNTGTMISDLKAYLDAAKARNILVIFVLWNGAVMNNQKVVDLAWDDSKLQTYIDKALTVNNKTGLLYILTSVWVLRNPKPWSKS